MIEILNKKVSVKRSLFIFVLLLLLLPGNALAQRSFGFPSLYIEAEVLPDGSMLVTEQRTASFRGTYSGLYQWIPTRHPIEITDISVTENGVSYRYNPGTTYGPAGTYYTLEEPTRLYVDWSFNATDETKVFTLQYRVKNVVQVHSDVAELYWQFVGDEWDVPVENVSVRLLLPPGAAKEAIRAWGHGPLHGEVVIVDGREITWGISPLPQRTFLEGRVAFPPELVPQANIKTGEPALPTIIREETAWADQANRQRSEAIWLWLLAGLIPVSSIGLAFFIWARYGREFRASFDGDYYRELPAEYTPAELGVLWRFGKPGPEDLTATILDLARKGYLSLEEYIPEKRGIFSKKTVDYRVTRLEKEGSLADHETKLLKLLFNGISAGGSTITFSDIEKYAEKSKVKFSKFWQDWQYTLAARGEVLGYFDQNIPTVRAIEIGLGLLLFFLGVVARSILTPALFIGGVVLVVAGLVLRRRSQQGAEDFVRWRAFRRFLLHFSEMEKHQIPSLVIWEYYLVYAVTLGVAKEVLKQLQVVYPNLESNGHRFGYGWYMHSGRMGVGSFTNMTNSFDSMTGSITRSLKTATSKSSSGTGGGGGFSSGGGGGFGGGGGGAR